MKPISLILVLLPALAIAQEVMGGWNLKTPPICSGLNVTLTYLKNFGQSDYNFTVDWGDSSSNDTLSNQTVANGTTVPFVHAYAAVGSYQIIAKAFVISFQTEVCSMSVLVCSY
jgi:hypothetical protein